LWNILLNIYLVSVFANDNGKKKKKQQRRKQNSATTKKQKKAIKQGFRLAF